MKALIVIDILNDFCVEDGALYSEYHRKPVDFIIKTIQRFKEEKALIVTAEDWHEVDDEEFKIFPPHCIENTHGAELIPEMKEVLKNYELHRTVKKRRFDLFFNTHLEEILTENEVDEAYVCGIVTNICVLFTVEELKCRDIETFVFGEGVNGYDQEAHRFALKQMKEVLGAKII